MEVLGTELLLNATVQLINSRVRLSDTRRFEMGYVYVAKCDHERHLKFGCVRSEERLQERQKEHRTSNPSFAFHLLEPSEAPDAMESFLKRYFASRRRQDAEEWFEVGVEELPAALELARQYVRDLLFCGPRLMELKKTKSTPLYLRPEPGDEATYRDLLDIFEKKCRLSDQWDRLTWQVQVRIGCNEGIDGLFKWKSLEKPGFDEKGFKEDHPELYKRYCRRSVQRRFGLF
jgi:hypothetical protein